METIIVLNGGYKINLHGMYYEDVIYRLSKVNEDGFVEIDKGIWIDPEYVTAIVEELE